MTRYRGYIVAIMAIVIFVVMLSYACVQLFAVRDALSTYSAGHMLWNVSQGEKSAYDLYELLTSPEDEIDENDVELKFDVFVNNVNVLGDGPQYEFYIRSNGKQNVTELNSIIDNFERELNERNSDSQKLLALFRPAFFHLDQLSNKAIIRQQIEAGQQRDEQIRATYLAIASIVGLLISGFALSWLLVTNIRALNVTQAELVAHKEHLEETIAARTAALQQSLENERQTNAVYKNFLTTVSHQFRTPIAIIDMIAQRFVRWPDDISRDILVERSQHIRNAVKRLGYIIESTINNDRLNECGVDLHMSEVDFVDVVNNACSNHGEMFKHRHLNKKLHVDAALIRGEATLLEQILANFLSNAEKYSPPSEPIDINLNIQDGHILCNVTDHGIGISAEDQPKIFDRFFRGPNVSHLEGTGLGLSLSVNLARLHGGEISCKSELNRGTTIELRLPLDGTSHG